MNWNALIRTSHRWLSVAFTGVVAAIFIALGAGRTPPDRVYYLPLAPLALMMLTGLHMLVLPCARRRGSEQGS